jgi:hypothetical protein
LRTQSPNLHPSEVPTQHFFCENHGPSTDLTISSNTSIDTTNDAECTGGIVDQPGGPGICWLRYRSIVLNSGATLRVTGTRAFALVADTALTIEGTLDASSDGCGTACSLPNGPGGGFTKSGGLSLDLNGSGGAGFKMLGGAGGTPALDGGAANGGAIGSNPADSAILVGGPSGGGGLGGGGGGAVLLVACYGNVSVSGIVDVGRRWRGWFLLSRPYRCAGRRSRRLRLDPGPVRFGNGRALCERRRWRSGTVGH